VAAVNTAAGLTARHCDAGLTGIVAGSKACIAGYSAAVWAHYRHIEEEWGEKGGGWEGGKTGEKEGGEKNTKNPR